LLAPIDGNDIWEACKVTTAPRKARRRLRLTLLALAALVLRALIPTGFMPAHDAPLALEICPEGFPAGLLLRAAHHHDHGAGSGAHADHCLFGSSCGGAPLLQASHCLSSVTALQVAMPRPTAPAAPVRLVHLPRARGPPRV
jgi:hypothetical protein